MTSRVGGHRHGPVRTAAASHHSGKIVRADPALHELLGGDGDAPTGACSSRERGFTSTHDRGPDISGWERGVEDMEELRQSALQEHQPVLILNG
jgi:hypothetical protein